MENQEKDWEIFVTIAEAGNITKAADKLFISQPALSYRLGQLEKNFEEPLFVRTTKGVFLTETGELYYAYAKDMLKRKNYFDELIQNKKSTVSGTLHLGSSSIFANYTLPELLAGFTKKYPQITLKIETGISSKIERLFIDNEIQVAIIRGPHFPSGKKIQLQTEPICLVTSKDCNRKELEKVPQIRYNTDPALYSVMDQWWKENFNVPPNACIHVDTMETCRHFIQKNLGWSVLPHTGLKNFANDFYIEPLTWRNGISICRETNLFYHEQKPQRRVVQAFIDYIKESNLITL